MPALTSAAGSAREGRKHCRLFDRPAARRNSTQRSASPVAGEACWVSDMVPFLIGCARVAMPLCAPHGGRSRTPRWHVGGPGYAARMTLVSFACGHGAAPTDVGAIALRRSCPLCMLLHETHRTRGELLSRAASSRHGHPSPPRPASAPNITWVCARGHDRYQATVIDVLTGPSCPKCIRNARGARPSLATAVSPR